MNDERLAQWAESRALSDVRAETIRRHILNDAGPNLGYEWWQTLFGPLRQGIRATSRGTAAWSMAGNLR